MEFVFYISTTVHTDIAMEVITKGFSISHGGLANAMRTITQQAYVGLNNDAGDWCRELGVAAYLASLSSDE